MTKVTDKQLKFTLLTQTNAGSAGGTMYYINLGGLKLLICHGNTIATVTSGTFFNFTLPTGFFSSVLSVTATANNPNATGSIDTEVDSYNTTSVSVKVTPASNQNSGCDIVVWGI